MKGDSKINMRMYTATDTNKSWEEINFYKAEMSVKKLQVRIAKAFINNEFEKMASLQHKLIHSFYAKAIAVKIVTSNKGKYTPGIDEVIWLNPIDKFNAISLLRRRGYEPMPLKRVYIQKDNGKFRPLGIPTMKDRAMQTLYGFSLEPISVMSADSASFAYLPNRSARKAIIRMHNILWNNMNYGFIMKTDVKSCFDSINHEWILKHIPMDKKILLKFLKCGYIDNSTFHLTDKGVPQGGCISSLICNMTLDGLEKLLDESFGKYVSFIRYADDMLIFGESTKFLMQEVTPVINTFLSERGLTLSEEKTNFYSVYDKVPFLGWEVYKSGDKIIPVPSRKSIDKVLNKVMKICQEYETLPYKELCNKLSQIVRGWVNYYIGIAPVQSLYGVEFEIVNLLSSLTGCNPAGFISNLFAKLTYNL